MAESGSILVSVLESTYTKLRKFGVPLPVCICMQDKGLQLESAQWTARQSCGGFSVTFFWPAPNQVTKATVKPSAKRKGRKRRRPKPVRPKKLFSDSVNGHASSSISGKQSVRTPFIAHHLSANSQKSAHPPAPDSNVDINQREDRSLDPTQCENPAEYDQSLPPDSSVAVSEASSHLDLTNCDSVAYEMKDGVPGMKFTVDGSDGWTPVRKRRCRPKSKMRISSDSEGSSSDVDVSCSRLVEYSVRDGVPGLTVFRRNATWTPVEPSPVASRLRTKSRFKYPN